METKSNTQTKFNQDILWHGRIAYAITMCNYSATELDAGTWFHWLMVFRRELISLVDEKQLKDIDSERAVINNLVIQNSSLVSRCGFNRIDPKLYDKLDALDVKLRLIAAKNGLIDVKADDGLAPENW